MKLTHAIVERVNRPSYDYMFNAVKHDGEYYYLNGNCAVKVGDNVVFTPIKLKTTNVARNVKKI